MFGGPDGSRHNSTTATITAVDTAANVNFELGRTVEGRSADVIGRRLFTNTSFLGWKAFELAGKLPLNISGAQFLSGFHRFNRPATHSPRGETPARESN